MLWRWAKRRHPTKPRRWVHARYFGQIGERRHVYHCTAPQQHGTTRLLTLFNAADVAITRHVKLTGSANPFNPAAEEYFEQRLTVKMERELEGKRKLLYLWKRQEGLCPVCGEAITKITRWHAHHLIPRVKGGTDASSNLYLLHPNCHRQHHNNPRLKWRIPVEDKTST